MEADSPPTADTGFDPFASIPDALWYWQTLPISERGAWLHQLQQRAPVLAAQVLALVPHSESIDRLNRPISTYRLVLTDNDSGERQDGDPPAPHVPGYECLELLGEGGHARVWLAVNPAGELVAIKLLRRQLRGTLAEERFRKEQLALRQLKHPNVPAIYEAGITPDGEGYFVLAYVSGKHLVAYADSYELGVAARVSLLQQVLAALQAAHDEGIVHRDVKPENILVSGPPDAPRVSLIDFGIAKLLDPDAAFTPTVTSDHAGTPAYMSPEQARRGPKYAEASSDIYSTGVVAFELLTGRLPYDAKQLSDAPVDAIRYAMPPRTTQFAPQVNAALDDVLARSLRKEPAERYPTARAFSEALQVAVTGERVETRGSRAAYRVRHWRHAHPRVFAGVITSTVVLASLGIWAVISNVAAREAANRAARVAYGQRLADVREAIYRGDLLTAADDLRAVPALAGPEWGWMTSLSEGPPFLWQSPSKISTLGQLPNGVAVGTMGGVATGISLDGGVLWEVASHNRPVSAIASNEGAHETIWIGHDDGRLQWIRSANPVTAQTATFSEPISALAAGDGGTLVASGRSLLWVDEAGTSERLATFPMPIACLALAQHGSAIVGLQDGTLISGTFGENSEWRVRWTVADAMSFVLGLAVYRDVVIALDNESYVHWLSLHDGATIRDRVRVGEGAIRLAASDGQLAIGTRSGWVRVIDIDNPASVSLRPLRTHQGPTSVCLTNGMFVSAGWDKTVRISKVRPASSVAPSTAQSGLAGFDPRSNQVVIADATASDLVAYSKNKVSRLGTPSPVTAIVSTGDQAWVGCRDGSWAAFSLPMHWQRGSREVPVTSLIHDANGLLWLGYADGQVTAAGTSVAREASSAQVMTMLATKQEKDPIAAAHVDGVVRYYPSGRVWLKFDEAIFRANYDDALNYWVAVDASRRRLLVRRDKDDSMNAVTLPVEATTTPVIDAASGRIVVGLADGSVACIDTSSLELVVTLPVSTNAIAGVTVKPSDTLWVFDTGGARFELKGLAMPSQSR